MLLRMDVTLGDNRHNYHKYVPDKDFQRIEGVDIGDPFSYSEGILKSAIIQPLLEAWRATLQDPFKGITNDGVLIRGLYQIGDEGAPAREMVYAGRRIVQAFSTEEKRLALRDLDTEEWRRWSNPEFIIYHGGVRLEFLDRTKIDLILNLVERSLSKGGYQKVRAAMKTNRFLGEICSRQAILNEYSYFFAVYGQPSETEPWGYSLFGHHLCLNVFLIGHQLSIGPVFLGAEPCIIDQGPDSGTELCGKEAELGLQLMQSLPTQLQQKAQTYVNLHDPTMPQGRWNLADQRHMAGAFQDNRIIPYEGVLATDMTEEQQSMLLSVVSTFLTLYPAQCLEHRLRQIRGMLPETYFSWIGGYGAADAFYYRIQSPVVLLEFDHHSGVFLTNDEPAKYHIHTIQRMPNGNDYGRELIRLFREWKQRQL